MSKSNQHATVNRVTLLESIAAARNETDRLRDFHAICREDPHAITWLREIDWRYNCLMTLARRLEAKQLDAQLEAWGDGP